MRMNLRRALAAATITLAVGSTIAVAGASIAAGGQSNSSSLEGVPLADARPSQWLVSNEAYATSRGLSVDENADPSKYSGGIPTPEIQREHLDVSDPLVQKLAAVVPAGFMFSGAIRQTSDGHVVDMAVFSDAGGAEIYLSREQLSQPKSVAPAQYFDQLQSDTSDGIQVVDLPTVPDMHHRVLAVGQAGTLYTLGETVTKIGTSLPLTPQVLTKSAVDLVRG
jgi:hypothetical protein